MKLTLAICLIGITISTIGFPQSQEEIQAMERAHAATEEIKQNFRSALSKSIQTHGIAKSIGECKVAEPKKAVNEMNGIEVGRTSLKVRNVKNAPRTWIKPYLEKFSKMPASEIPKETLVTIGKSQYGYLEPIFVEGICLNCHGKSIDKSAADEIKALYPADQATGYSQGELRGLLWLEFKSK